MNHRLKAGFVAVMLAASAALTVTSSPAQASAPVAKPAAKGCLPGAPSLAVKVGWVLVDQFHYAMQPHIQVSNCNAKIKTLRVIMRSLRAGGTGLVEQDVMYKDVQAKKYGNAAMMVHITKFLRAYMPDPVPPATTRVVVGLVMDDAAPPVLGLMSCTQMSDATKINTNDYSFTIRVEPLDGYNKVIPTVATAQVGPFACGAPAGTI